MPKSKYRKRGGVVRYRTKRLSKSKYLTCAVVRKKGKRGGRTICTVHKKKRKRR